MAFAGRLLRGLCESLYKQQHITPGEREKKGGYGAIMLLLPFFF
jgi:hypothetical protein